MQDAREYTLEELADAAAMTERNVRAYASRGLLPASRRQGRRTRYGSEHVARLRLVRALHQHGLTLRVIGDLVERGTADAELARLGREELGGPGPTRVPMSAAIVETYQREHPGGMEALVAAGLVAHSDGGRYVASATGLGIVAALSARGIGVADSAAVSLSAADAASRCAPEVRSALQAMLDRSDVGGAKGGTGSAGVNRPEAAGDDELVMLVVQLAASAFADVLAAELA